MSDYSELDAQIVDSVRFGYSRFLQLSYRHDNVEWRVIDRRLQSLRKRGVLTFTRAKGWTVKRAK